MIGCATKLPENDLDSTNTPSTYNLIPPVPETHATCNHLPGTREPLENSVPSSGPLSSPMLNLSVWLLPSCPSQIREIGAPKSNMRDQKPGALMFTQPSIVACSRP